MLSYRSISTFVAVLLLLVSLAGGSPSEATIASPGALDSSFGTNGWAITDVAGETDYGGDLAIQSDGKLVAVGMATSGASEDFAVVRYLADGALDNSFGSGGKVIVDLAGSQDRAAAVGIQGNGGLLVAGWSNSGASAALVRLNPDGSLDQSFGNNGKITTNFGALAARFFDVAVQADQKILAVGWATFDDPNGLRSTVALARYNPDGTPDETFGRNGSVIQDFASLSMRAGGYALLVQPDGKILVGGGAEPRYGGDGYYLVLRYTSSGVLDESFGDMGRTLIQPEGYSASAANAMVLQPDGKILLTGVVLPTSEDAPFTNDLGVARLNSDGNLDATFGVSGTLLFGRQDQEEVPTGIGLQSDGRIVVGGTLSHSTDQSDLLVVRLSEDGGFDPTFGMTGTLTIDWPDRNAIMQSLAIQDDDKIVGIGHVSDDDAPYDLAVLRLLREPFTGATHWTFMPLVSQGW